MMDPQQRPVAQPAPGAFMGLPTLQELRDLRRHIETHHHRMVGHVRALQQHMSDRLRLMRELFLASADMCQNLPPDEQEFVSGTPHRSPSQQADASAERSGSGRQRSPSRSPEERGGFPLPFPPPPAILCSSGRRAHMTLRSTTELITEFVGPSMKASDMPPLADPVMRKLDKYVQEHPLAEIPAGRTAESVINWLRSGTSSETFTISDRCTLHSVMDGRLATAVRANPTTVPFQARADSKVLSLVATKRARTYAVFGTRQHEPGEVIALQTVDDVGEAACDVGIVVLCIAVDASGAAAGGCALASSHIPETVVVNHYREMGADSSGATPSASQLQAAYTRRPVEGALVSICNSLAADLRLPIVVVDADLSVDRTHLVLTYRCDTPFDPMYFIDEVEGAVRVTTYWHPVDDSCDLLREFKIDEPTTPA